MTGDAPAAPGKAGRRVRTLDPPQSDPEGLEVLSRGEAITLLASQEVGHLVYTRRALPAVTPVNFTLRGGAILIWTGSGSELGRAVRGAVVAFQADGLDRVLRSGWSVTVTGAAVLVTDGPQIAAARAHAPTPWEPGPLDHLISIPLTIVTGRWFGRSASAVPGGLRLPAVP